MTIKISAVYYPQRQEAEATWECDEIGKKVAITFPVTEDQGEDLSEIVQPCVYQEVKTTTSCVVTEWRYDEPPKNGEWILAVFTTQFFPKGVPAVVRWFGWKTYPEQTDHGWAMPGGFPKDMFPHDPIKWAKIRLGDE